MSFINWGHESPEQKAIRRKLEEDEMMIILEQRAANAATAAAAAAAGASVLGQRYCGGEKLLDEFVYLDFDFLYSSKFTPTDAQFESYDTPEDDAAGPWRAGRDEYGNAQADGITARAFGKISEIPSIPDIPEPLSLFYKSIKTASNVTKWKEVDQMEGWNTVRPSGFSAAQKMPGVKYFNFLNEVELISNLPNSGKPGDFVWCIENSSWYGWDSDVNSFTLEFAALYGEDYFGQMRESMSAALKAKNEMSLASRPFMFAAKYILDYKVKNKF